ncbi:MAG: pilus assembly protein TadG-related protein [Nitriliruptoraceae bacterium]
MKRARNGVLSGAEGQSGFASLAFPLVLWVAVVAGVVVIDAGAYVVAAARAQTAADAAALAAAASAAPMIAPSAQRQAEQAAVVNGARVEYCDCAGGGDQVRVEVSVAVAGLLVPHLGATRVTAEATAQLRRPAGLSPTGGLGDVFGSAGSG